MFEYIMIDNVNDSEEQAKELAKLMSRSLYFVNLITYNLTGIFKPSSNSKNQEIQGNSGKRGVVVTQRFGFGQDIEGACGQLAAKK